MAGKRCFSIELFDSDKFLSLSPGAFRLYVYLNLCADDYGVTCTVLGTMRKCEANNEDLTELEKAGLILKFKDGGLAIADWLLHNQIQPSKITNSKFVKQCQQLSFHRDTQRYFLTTTLSEEQRNSGDYSPIIFNGGETAAIPRQNGGNPSAKRRQNGDETATQDNTSQENITKRNSNQLMGDNYTDDFNSFWENYPKKVDKSKSFIEFQSAVDSGIDPKLIIEGAKCYANAMKSEGRKSQYITQPKNWLSNRRWEDDCLTAKNQDATLTERYNLDEIDTLDFIE